MMVWYVGFWRGLFSHDPKCSWFPLVLFVANIGSKKWTFLGEFFTVVVGEVI